MPGVSFGGGYAGSNGPPQIQRFPVACGLTGSDTQGTSGAGSGAMYNGDIVVETSNATWGTSPLNAVNVVSVRKLTYADLVTNSLGNGVLGVNTEDFTTDSNGRFGNAPTWGLTTTPIPKAVPNPSSLWMQNIQSLRNEIPIMLAGRGNGFKARIVPTYTTAVMGQNLNQTQAGISIVTGLNAPIAVQGNTTTAGAQGTLASGWYSVIFTYVNQDSQANVFGESLGSTPFAVNITANGLTLVATGVLATTAFTNIAKYYKTYVAGPYTSQALALAAPMSAYFLQNGATSTVYTATGTNLVLSVPPLTTGVNAANPPTANTTGQPGISQYYIDPGASTKFIRIIEVNTVDPLYGTLFTTGNTIPGPEADFTFNIAQCQNDPGNTLAAYTT